jgi:hypothetical protein
MRCACARIRMNSSFTTMRKATIYSRGTPFAGCLFLVLKYGKTLILQPKTGL